MKFAFYTTVFSDLSLEEVAGWAKGAGFDGVEIDFGRHIREPENTATAVGIARETGLEVCAITLFGNLLDRDADARNRTRNRVIQVFGEATRMNIPALVVFPGRNESVSEEQNYEDISEFFEGLLATGKGGTKVLIENWPGMNKNFVATTPGGWRRLFFLVKSPSLGLEFRSVASALAGDRPGPGCARIWKSDSGRPCKGREAQPGSNSGCRVLRELVGIPVARAR